VRPEPGDTAFRGAVANGRHPGVDAFVNLSRFRAEHIRSVMNWPETGSSWRPAVASLAHHLICEYEVPFFLASSWYATEPATDHERGWFVAHSRGASFRSLNLPLAMTRKMERIFLASPDHLSVRHAIRRAELLALGTPAEILKAVMSHRLAPDLRHSEFWRTVWAFLIKNAGDVDPTQIGPMIDYIQSVRHDRIAVETPDGPVEFDPPQPGFSMKGRSVQSILRLMREWHQSLSAGGAGFFWTRSQFAPLLLEETRESDASVPKSWHITELTNSAQLRAEGAALHHCVASYADRCSRGTSSIWSLRLCQGERAHSVLTIEIDPRRRAIIQARGRANRAASGKPLRLLQDWAVRERLPMAI
jgi:hypothetical protein